MTCNLISQSIQRYALGGGGFSSVEPNAPGPLTRYGVVAPGNELTIETDGTYNFGVRENIKPLYVNDGTSKTSSSLGRLVDDYYSAIATVETDQPNGSIANSIRFDIQASFTNRLYQDILFDPDKPLILYIERYYESDITDPAKQSGGDYNLKTNRFFGDISTEGGNTQNFYIGYQGSEGATSARVGAEYIDQGAVNGSKAYESGNPFAQWTSEEIIFINSSAPGLTDGRLYHYRDNVLLNPDAQDHSLITYSTLYPTKPYYDWGDQWSNSGSATGPQYIWAGLHIRDDEWNGVYVGNAATLAACTKLVRLPQTAWNATSVSFVYYETRIPSANAHFYIRTGYDTWVSSQGIQ